MADELFQDLAKSKVLTPEEIKELQLAARRAFKSPAARRVLVDFLVDECYFGAYVSSDRPEMVGRYNAGIALMSRLGIFSADKELIFDALLSVPIKGEL